MKQTYILGIFHFGFDPAACILKNGKLIAYMEEDKFTRVKHAYNQFPSTAISFCLNFANIDISDVDFISVGWGTYKYPYEMSRHYLKGWYKYQHIKDERTLQWELNNLERFQTKHMKNDISKKIIKTFGENEIPQIDFVRHHLSHAISAYNYSGFNQASILTIDGSGEENSTVLWKGDSGAIAEIISIDIPDSLGWFYSGFTEYLGFKPYDGEGKVMGMAPYGKFNNKISKIVDKIVKSSAKSEYKIDPNYIFYGKHSHGERFTDKLVKELGLPPRKPNDPIEKYVDVAFHVQRKLEETTGHLVRDLIQKTSIRNICLSGGVAYNCKMNASIREMEDVKNIFTFPISGDNGTAIGAALATYQKYYPHQKVERMEQVYLGVEFSNEEIKKFLDTKQVKYSFIDDIGGVAGKLLAKGKIVGWFQGRQEGGPRALGNRSILADPRKAKNKERLNIAVKNREPWRPFAPSILHSAMEEYLEMPCESPFMILSFKVRQEKIREIPAVVHVDGTTRPQTVRKKTNPLYWSLIKSFEEETSVPVVLNTSFNKRGEPMVCTPRDAFNDFITTDIDILVMGNYLVDKRDM